MPEKDSFSTFDSHNKDTKSITKKELIANLKQELSIERHEEISSSWDDGRIWAIENALKQIDRLIEATDTEKEESVVDVVLKSYDDSVVIGTLKELHVNKITEYIHFLNKEV